MSLESQLSRLGLFDARVPRYTSYPTAPHFGAGVGPQDMSVAEVHDASAMGEILNAESLMLVPFGHGGPAAERGDFTVGGKIPINPSGGLDDLWIPDRRRG